MKAKTKIPKVREPVSQPAPPVDESPLCRSNDQFNRDRAIAASIACAKLTHAERLLGEAHQLLLQVAFGIEPIIPHIATAGTQTQIASQLVKGLLRKLP
jgi:hypothetical protein